MQNFSLIWINYSGVKDELNDSFYKTSFSLVLDLASYFFLAFSLLLEEKLIKNQKINKLDIITFEGLWSLIMFTTLLSIDYLVPCKYLYIFSSII